MDNSKEYERYPLYKNSKKSKVWWVANYDVIGEHVFTFDKKTFYNLFADYRRLTDEQKAIIKADSPELANLFAD